MVDIAGGLAKLFGPDTRQQRQQELLTAERNANQQVADGKFFDELLVDGLITKEGRVNFDKLVEKDSTGYKYQNQIVKLLNQSNKFKQFTDTQEGMDKLGIIEGFRDNEDGTKTILTRRPDTKLLAPKTWLATDDPNDLVANLNQTQFEDLIQGNVAILRKRANPNLGQGVVAQSVQQDGPTDIVTGDPIAEAGEVLDEIDKTEGINLQDANEAMLGLVSDLGTRLRETETKPGEEQALTEEEQKEIPILANVVDTSSPETQASAALISNLNPETILSDDEIVTLSQGLSKGFRVAFRNQYKFGQAQLQANQRAIDQADERAKPRLEKIRQRLIQSQQERIDRVRKNIEDDTATRQGARDKVQAKADAERSAIERQLADPNLSADRRQQLEAELEAAKPVTEITSTSFKLNGELTDGATKEEVQAFFDNNKETIEAISKDGDLVNRFRDVISKYGVETEEDLNKVPFGTAQANNVTYQDAAIVLAAYDKQQNFADALFKYMGVYDRKMSMDKTALETDILYGDYLRDQRKYRQELTQEFIDAEAELIPLLFDEDGDYQAFTGETRAKVSNLLNQVKNLPGAPKFVVKDGKYEIQTEGDFARDSLKGIAGLLFAQAVEVEGSVDFKDWFQGLFSPGDPKNIGNLIDNVRFERVNPGDPNSPIREIFFTPAGSNREAQGSLKPGDFTFRFGGPNENAYARNLIMYYIQEYGKEDI
tara:strand:- start:613 stop:2751 length:2139 start_codon:yes stop_codon:yes gene_type:complete